MSGRFSAHRILEGLQAGTAAGLVFLGWIALTMVWAKHSAWWYANLLATCFGGDGALREAFTKYTLTGLSLHVVLYGSVGALFAFAVPPRTPGTRILLAGAIVGVAWHYFLYGYAWKHVNPLITLYSPDRQILVGNILYGLMLGRLPSYAAVESTSGNVE